MLHTGMHQVGPDRLYCQASCGGWVQPIQTMLAALPGRADVVRLKVRPVALGVGAEAGVGMGAVR